MARPPHRTYRRAKGDSARGSSFPKTAGPRIDEIEGAASSDRQKLTCIVLLLLGIACAWMLGVTPWERPVKLCILAVAVLLSLVPQVNRPASAYLDALRNPSRRAARRTAFVVAIISCAYLLGTAWRQGREFVPTWQDEHMYLLQARLLAHGRLWTAAHPMADFFETFYVFTRPVYAPIYFPGTALLYVPAVWLGLPGWLWAAMVAGGVVGLMYRVVTDLLDGVCGLLASFLLLSLASFRFVSTMTQSNTALMLLALGAVWAWLAWRRRDSPRAWGAVILGLFTGWALITRPLDALCYAIPLAIAVILDLRGRSWGQWFITIVAGIAGVAPMLALQAVMNVGITGSVLKTPADLYQREWPGLTFTGFRAPDPGAHAFSSLPQKQDFFRSFLLPAMEAHRPGAILDTWFAVRLPQLVSGTLSDTMLVPLLFVGLLGVFSRRRWVVVLSLPLFVGVYVFNPFFLQSYTLSVAPAMVLLLLSSLNALTKTLPSARAAISVTGAVFIFLLAAFSLPELHRKPIDLGAEYPTMFAVYKHLPEEVQQPALVLFTYRSGVDMAHEEPVYNIETVNPDDAPIIRAHDLGADRNREIIRYYGQRQPNRHVYRFEREGAKLTEMGTAGGLLRAMDAAR